MDREKAIKIFGPEMKIETDNGLHNDLEYVAWSPDSDTITLDGQFTVKQIEALDWWIRTYKVGRS